MTWKPDYVTDAQLSAYVRIDDDVDDVEIGNAITGASRAVDHHTNRQFGLLAAPAQWSYTAWPDYERGLWVVTIDDLMTTTGLVVETPSGGTTTAYTLEPKRNLAQGKPYTRLVFDRDASVYPLATDEYEVLVTGQFGWTVIPAPVVLATKLQASRFLSRRESPYGIAGSPDAGSEMRLLARVDPDVGVSLKDYTRPRGVG